MGKPVTLYIARHGKTMLNTTQRVQGWIDSPLTQEGVEIAKKLGRGFQAAPIKFDLAYSSDQPRAYKTAQLVLANNDQSQLEIKQLSDLREECFGDFEGALDQELLETLFGDKTLENLIDDGYGIRDLADAVASYQHSKTPEEGESYDMLSKRIDRGFLEVAKEAQAKGAESVLVVSHGNTITTWLDRQGIPVKEIGYLHNASVSIAVYDEDKFNIEEVNQMTFVEAGSNQEED